jgi:hypothetical protein
VASAAASGRCGAPAQPFGGDGDKPGGKPAEIPDREQDRNGS